jgi:2-polyprenyl-6-hydroxyphenyl methylase/3-demethylubiquinone-9 3-methyltransferase
MVSIFSTNGYLKAKSFIKRKILRDYKARLDHQYAAGRWESLSHLSEMAHHQILAGYVLRLNPKGTVLDLGCGEGVLNDSIQKHNYQYYVGVDLSSDAARIANERRGDDKTVFCQGNMDHYVPTQTFDFIIINEALYFSENPRKLLNRLDRYLNQGGHLMVSMLTPNGDYIWEELSKDFDFLDENFVTNINKITWCCRLLRKKA